MQKLLESNEMPPFGRKISSVEARLIFCQVLKCDNVFFFTWVFLLALRKPAWPEKTSRLWNRHRRADKRRHTWKDKTSLMLPPLLSSSPSLLFFFNRSAVHFSPFNANRHFESFKLFSISFLLPSILGVYLKHLTSLLLLQLLLQKMGKKHCFLLFRPNVKKP